MKKCLFLLIAILLLVPAICLAQPPSMPYDASLSLRYRQLTPSQKALFDILYEAVAAGESIVTFDQPVRYDDVEPVMTVLRVDCPELCALSYSYSTSYYRNAPDEATGVTLQYDLPLSTQAELMTVARSLFLSYPNDPFSCELGIHDMICKQVDYVDNGPSHTAYGALVCHQAVCDGYTKAMTLLCRLAGIPCSMLEGEADGSTGPRQPHAWNILIIDGVYTQVDVTWDDQDIILYNYFNVTDSMIGVDHYRDTESAALPRCTDTSVNWHVRSGTYLPNGTTPAAFIERFMPQLEQGSIVFLRFPNASTLSQARQALSGRLSCTYWQNNEQFCLTIVPR